MSSFNPFGEKNFRSFRLLNGNKNEILICIWLLISIHFNFLRNDNAKTVDAQQTNEVLLPLLPKDIEQQHDDDDANRSVVYNST